MSFEPGLVVAGKYKLRHQLGTGGMADVYLAVNLNTDHAVALKVIPADSTRAEERLYRFQQEARATPRVRHAGIVTVIDAGRDGELFWLAMEALEGESLAQRLAKGPLPVPLVVAIFEQLLDVLEHVHRAEIVHRDLKPENVFLQGDPAAPRVRLLDFGIAKLRDESVGVGRTRSGVYMGTIGHMAPEQMRDARDVDARADVYAVGVLLYQCLTGRLPYIAQTFAEQVAKQHVEPPAPLPPFSDPCARALGALALRCLASEPDGRPESAPDVLRAVRRARDAADDDEPPAVSNAARARARAPWIVCLTAGPIIGIASFFGLSHGGAPPGPAPLPTVPMPPEPRLSVVEVEVKTDVEDPILLVDGETMGPGTEGRWQIKLWPGPHRLEAGANGSVMAATVLSLQSGEPASVVLTLPSGVERGAGPRPAGRVLKGGSIARTSGPGALSPEAVAGAVGRRLGVIRGCYDRAFQRDERIRGVLTLGLTIAADGRITAVTSEHEPTITPEIAACVRTQVLSLTVQPRPEGGSVKFAYPLLFAP